MSPSEFHTLADYQTALDALIAEAQWRLRIYDATLEKAGLNATARYERLRVFCLGSPQRRIEILLDDPAHVQTQCPRLMSLLRDFSHIIEIRQTESESERPAHGFALADRSVWLKRFDKDALPGQWARDDAAGAVLLHQEFEQLWQRAIPNVSASTLGLA